MRLSRLSLLLVTCVLASFGNTATPLRIAVAANFKPTLVRLNPSFEETSGIAVSLSGASTGALATQIEHGAPFDLFFSADRESAFRVSASISSAAEPFCYARGSLVLVGADSLMALAQADLSLAIANPATAPYGKAAVEVLDRSEFSNGIKRKLVRGNNVAQVYQFWHSGTVDLALIPRALAPAQSIPIPQDWHLSLEQYAVVIKPGAAVDAYLQWLRSDTVRALILEAGYEPCP